MTQAAYAVLLLFLIVAGSGAVVVFSIVFERRKMRRDFSRLTQALGGTLRDRALQGTYRGVPFAVGYHPGGRHSAPSCHVELKVVAQGRLTIRQEDPFDQAAKRKGLATEVQTGDAEFDQRWYVDSDDPQFARRYLDRADRRNAVTALLMGTANAGALTLGATGIAFEIRSFNTARLEPEEISKILDLLVRLGQDLPGASAESSRTRGRMKPLLAATLTIFVGGDALTVAGLVMYPPIDNGIAWIGVLCYFSLLIPYLMLAFRLLKGTSSSHTDFGLIVGLSVFAFAPVAAGLAVFANGRFDSSPRVTHVVTIKEARTFRGKQSTVYQLVHESWQRPGETDVFPVDRAVFDRAKVGDRLTFTVANGLFGSRWQAGHMLSAAQH